MNAQPQIRDAVPSDGRAIADLMRESAEAHASLSPEFYRVPAPEEALLRVERRIGAEGATLVAVVDARVVGVVELTPMPPPSPGSMIRPLRALDVGIVVGRDWRGRGIGRALMEAAEDRARRLGMELLVLDASAANTDALRLYRSVGYEQAGVLMHRWIG